MVSVRRVAAMRALWTVVRASRRPDVPGIGQRLAALPRMVAQGFTGRYPHLGKRRIVLVLFALAFLISPVDRIPEILLPLLGFADDAVLVAWIAGTILAETGTFLEWESHLGDEEHLPQVHDPRAS